MSLAEIVKEVKKYGDNKTIVEFNNGFGVAYEKTNCVVEQEVFDSDDVCVDVVQKKVSRICYRELEPTTDKISGAKSLSGKNNRSAYFSRELENLLSAPQTSAQVHAQELESKIEKGYDAMIKPLQIEECKFRDWKNILECVGTIVGLTAIWPLSMLYILLGGMRKRDISGDVTLSLVTAPLALPSVLAYAAREIVSPTTKANRINNAKMLSQKQEGNNAYLLFQYNEKATISRYRCIEFVVQERIHLSEGTKSIHKIYDDGGSTHPSDERAIYARKETREDSVYGGRKFFFKVDEDLSAEISIAVEEKEKLQAEYHNFCRQLNQKSQTEMLKRIGFI